MDVGPPPEPSLGVLLVNSLYHPQSIGGAEAVTQMLAVALAAGGHRVSVVTTCSAADGASRERRDGVDVFRFFPRNLWWLHDRFVPGDRRSALAKLRWRVTDAWNRDTGRRFGAILDQVRPDIVHTHNIKGLSPAVWAAARRHGGPVVHTAHSYDLVCADGSLVDRARRSCPARARCLPCRVHGAWYAAQARAIDVFCSPSDYLLRAHAEAGLVPRQSVTVRNGVPRCHWARPHRDPAAPRRFLFLGQLAAHKGIATLLAAIGLAGGRFTVDIAGRGEAAAAVEALARVDARVRFHGFVESGRKDQLLAEADILLFPSIWVENAPMSIAEAFRHGLPVIGSRMGAIPEFVQDGVDGLLFDPADPAALAACMTRLCQHPGLFEQLAQGAERTGGRWPDPAAMAADYVAVYRSVLATRQPAGAGR